MKEKEFSKLPIFDLFDYMLETGEVASIIDAIRKERGDEKPVQNESEQLRERKNILKNLSKK